jgi:hypothetical protein
MLAAAVFVAGAGLASAAVPPCYPDPAGTRTFEVRGAVTGYGFVADRVVVDWARPTGCAGTAVWDFQTSPAAKAPTACTRSARPAPGAAAHPAAADGTRFVRVRLALPNADLPDRLDVFDRRTHRRLASWPLIDRPALVDLNGDLAVLSAAHRHALYVMRISDGRIAKIGVTQPGDRPAIGPHGVLYQDDMMIANDRDASGRTLPVGRGRSPSSYRSRPCRRRWIPSGHRSHVRSARSPWTAPRVAFAVRDPQGICDTLRLWNVPWNVAANITRKSGQTCLPTHAPGGITDVALAGTRAAWTTMYGGTTACSQLRARPAWSGSSARPSSVEHVVGSQVTARSSGYALLRRLGGSRRGRASPWCPRPGAASG